MRFQLNLNCDTANNRRNFAQPKAKRRLPFRAAPPRICHKILGLLPALLLLLPGALAGVRVLTDVTA